MLNICISLIFKLLHFHYNNYYQNCIHTKSSVYDVSAFGKTHYSSEHNPHNKTKAKSTPLIIIIHFKAINTIIHSSAAYINIINIVIIES